MSTFETYNVGRTIKIKRYVYIIAVCIWLPPLRDRSTSIISKCLCVLWSKFEWKEYSPFKITFYISCLFFSFFILVKSWKHYTLYSVYLKCQSWFQRDTTGLFFCIFFKILNRNLNEHCFCVTNISTSFSCRQFYKHGSRLLNLVIWT